MMSDPAAHPTPRPTPHPAPRPTSQSAPPAQPPSQAQTPPPPPAQAPTQPPPQSTQPPPQSTQPPPTTTKTKRDYGKYLPPVGASVLTLLAAGALIASLLGTTWFALFGKFNVDFAALRTATSPDSAPKVQHIYFAYLGVILTIVVVALLVAETVVPLAVVTRLCQIVVVVGSLVGLALTLFAIKQLDKQDPSGGFVDHLKWLRVGGYLHLAGFVLALAAARSASSSSDRGN